MHFILYYSPNLKYPIVGRQLPPTEGSVLPCCEYEKLRHIIYNPSSLGLVWGDSPFEAEILVATKVTFKLYTGMSGLDPESPTPSARFNN